MNVFAMRLHQLIRAELESTLSWKFGGYVYGVQI